MVESVEEKEKAKDNGQKIEPLQKRATQAIWWLASYPKSGSTWIRLFLDCYMTGFPLRINSPYHFVSGDLKPRMYQQLCSYPISELEDGTSIYYHLAAMANFVYEKKTAQTVVKTHNARVFMDGIPMIPQALTVGAIYVVRDPRDIAPSFAKHTDTSIDQTIDNMENESQVIEKSDSKLYHILGSWSSHVKSWCYSKEQKYPVFVIKYEDLVSDPGNNFYRIMGAMRGLGYELDKERVDWAIEETQLDKLCAEEERLGGFTEKGKADRFFGTGAHKHFTEKLTKEQIRRIETAHGDVMQKFGYELTEV